MSDKKRTPRIVTEATKAKLPKPRKRKPKDTRRPARHSDYVETPSPIAGQALPEVGTMPAPDFRPVLIPCMDWPADSLPSGDPTYTFTPSYVPPDTAPYPWPLKFAWAIDSWLANLARRFA